MSADDRSNTRATGQPEERFDSPDDPPLDDPIERLGKRIGRALSYLLAAALVIHLWYTYLR
jgi:hypothetical protein